MAAPVTSRRDILIGGACATASAAAWALRPRTPVALIGDTSLDAAIPRNFTGWNERPTAGIVAPVADDSLAARLYNQIVMRTYVDGDGAMVMLLIAYGRTQNDALQLHRPEVCYPALGYDIVANAPMRIPLTLARSPAITGRQLTATGTGQTEQILYWTRIGENFPTSASAQRAAKLHLQLAGIIPDGVLVRFSNQLRDRAAGLALNARFVRAFIAGCPPRARLVLMGRDLSSHLAQPARAVRA